MGIPVVAVIGPSDSGKTRVATGLVARLAQLGYRVAAIKHASHGHEPAKPGSDSSRIYEAGAVTVVAASPGQQTTVRRVDGDQALEEIAAALPGPHDVVIAEGFKGSRVPKVFVPGKEWPWPAPTSVIAVVGPGADEHTVPHYTFDDLDALAKQVAALIEEARNSATPSVSLSVNGKTVPLAPFPQAIFDGTIRGLLGSLKGVPDSPGEIRITLYRPKP